MRIIGIDPGTRVAGYGVVDVLAGGRVVAVAAGVWKLPVKAHLAQRLAQLCLEFNRVVDAYTPQQICLEMAFVAENPKSALSLGHARGGFLSQAYLRGLGIFEMSATAAKKCVTNFGRSDKHQVAAALESLLGVKFSDIPLDASDALALAYAQAMNYSLNLGNLPNAGTLLLQNLHRNKGKAKKDFSSLFLGKSA